MRVALSEMVVDGIKTNIPLQQRIMADIGFQQGGAEHPLPREAAEGTEGKVDLDGVEPLPPPPLAGEGRGGGARPGSINAPPRGAPHPSLPPQAGD